MTTTDKTVRTPTEYPHIERDYKGRPVIAGTRMRVSMVVNITHAPDSYTPAQIVEHYDGLTLSQVHNALSYYYDHKSEIDAEIEEEDRYVEGMRKLHEDPAFWEQVRARRIAKGLTPR